MRKQNQLNFDWKFQIIEKEVTPSTLDFTKSSTISIPHTIVEVDYHHFSEKDYQVLGVYQKQLTFDSVDLKNHYILTFDGVMNKTSVWINDKQIKTHKGGYTPFSVELNDYLHVDLLDYTITVYVDASEIDNIPPFGNAVDYLGYGGIYREVHLDVYPETYIEDVTIKTRECLQSCHHTMLFELKVNLNQVSSLGSQIKYSIIDDGNVLLSKSFPIEGKGIFKQEDHDDIKRWSITNPKLYVARIEYILDDEVIDEIDVRFGYREAEFQPTGFYLNNDRIKLIGLDRHQSYPYVGYAMPKRLQEMDADILKYQLGCNIVRCSHYMQSDHFINRCDEIGLLVFEEIPGWQYIGDEEFKELTLDNLTAMIVRHKNHPSIVLWGTRINESPDDHDFYTKTSELAMELDDSRQTGGVRNFAKSELLEDVYTYNDFSHTGDNPGLDNPMKITMDFVPYLVTEHNGHMYPTKPFDPESIRAKHAMRHLNVFESAKKYGQISGAIGWCYADYNTHKDFGSGDRICYHGVLDMYRNPKYAAAAYASEMDAYPVLEVLSNMNIGEYPRSVIPKVDIISNCDYIKVYCNKDYISTIYPDKKNYPHLNHPPFVIDDFIGERIFHDKYPKKIATRIKKVLQAYYKYDFNMPLIDKLRMADLMVIHRFTMEDAMEIYGKYLGNWGKEAAVYRFEGYLKDELVITKHRGPNKSYKLISSILSKELEIGDTYDVTQVTVKLVDEYDNVYPYGNNIIHVETSDHLETIYEKDFALVGGQISIYFKTKKKGKAKIKLTSKGFDSIEYTVSIK